MPYETYFTLRLYFRSVVRVGRRDKKKVSNLSRLVSKRSIISRTVLFHHILPLILKSVWDFGLTDPVLGSRQQIDNSLKSVQFDRILTDSTYKPLCPWTFSSLVTSNPSVLSEEFLPLRFPIGHKQVCT